MFGFWNLFLLYCFYSVLENPIPLFKTWLSLGRFPDNPFPEKIHNWLVFGKALFVCLWTFLLAWRTGKKIRLFFKRSVRAGFMELFLDFSLGLLALNTLWMGLGLTGLWFPSLWGLWTLLAGIWVIWDLRADPRRVRLEVPRHRWSIPHLLFGILTFLYLAFLVGQDLLPETFYDSLNYFLGMPQAWLNRHGICDLPTQMLSGYFHGGSLFS